MRKHNQGRTLHRVVSFSLVMLSLIALAQLGSQLPAGSAAGPQQKVVTVTVYVPVYQTVYVQQPVPYPVTYTVTAYRTTSFTFNSTVSNLSVSTYVVLVSVTQFNSSRMETRYRNCSYTSTITNTNATYTIAYGYSSGSTTFTSYITGVPVDTFTGYTTCVITPAPVTVSVPALFGVPLPQEYIGVTLLMIGGVVGLGAGYLLKSALSRNRARPR